MVQLNKTSNYWSGTYHTLIAFAIKNLQYLDNSAIYTTTTAKSLSSHVPESDSMKKIKLEKPIHHYIRVSKSTLSHYHQMSLQTLKKTSHSNKKPAPKTQHSGYSSGPVMVWVDDNSSRIFTISENFTFPHFKCILKDIKKIAGTPWVKELAQIMAKSREYTIFAITVNAGYKESLLNWLISAVFKGDLSLDRILLWTKTPKYFFSDME